jgi:hypothetical protein
MILVAESDFIPSASDCDRAVVDTCDSRLVVAGELRGNYGQSARKFAKGAAEIFRHP